MNNDLEKKYEKIKKLSNVADVNNIKVNLKKEKIPIKKEGYIVNSRKSLKDVSNKINELQNVLDNDSQILGLESIRLKAKIEALLWALNRKDNI